MKLTRSILLLALVGRTALLRALVEGSRELDTMRWNLKRMRKTESAQHLARLLMHIAQGGISPNLQRLPQVDLAG